MPPEKSKAKAKDDDLEFVVTSTAAVCRVFEVDSKTVYAWAGRGCPGIQPRRYDIIRIIRWIYRESTRRQPLRVRAESDGDDDVLLAEGSSPALERYRTARARIAELQANEAEGTYVHVGKMQVGLQRMAAILREAGDKLQKRHGPDAKAVLDEHLDAFEALIPELFGTSDT